MGRISVGNLEKVGIAGGDVLIQSGTGPYTHGLFRVAALFRECHSIELNDLVHAAAQRTLARAKNVRLYLGDSADVLPDIIDRTKETVFFLDAHAEAGANVSNPCPVLAELEIIFSADWKTRPVIVIDDVKYFQDWFWNSRRRSRGCSRAGWPTISQIEAIAAANHYTLEAIRGMALLRPKQ